MESAPINLKGVETSDLSIWYPSWDFYLEMHSEMLRKYGGYPGIKGNGKAIFEVIMKEVKETDGLFEKAAVMLSRLRRTRIVEDAQKRTAFIVTLTFLEMNGEKVKLVNSEEFVKGILKYNLDDIVRWLRNGRSPR